MHGPERNLPPLCGAGPLWGCVGTQSTLPFGTADEVRARTGELLELCRERGRLVLAPTHLVEPEVPLENLDAMVETIRTFASP